MLFLFLLTFTIKKKFLFFSPLRSIQQFDQTFRPYLQYCLEHSRCLQYLKEKRKSNVLFNTYILVSICSINSNLILNKFCFANFVSAFDRINNSSTPNQKWCENHKDCERLGLMDLLVKPMQRLTKYSLLLKAILKKTDDSKHQESLMRMVCVAN